MTAHLVYVIGAPGSGKTTLVNGTLDLLGEGDARTQPIPHTRYGDIWYLGKRRPQFGGTDALSMSIQPRVVEWLAGMTQAHAEHPRILLAEGDRLANAKFFDTVRACGHRLTIIHLVLDPTECRTRANRRAQQQGTEPQPATWWKGRLTKVTNLANSRRTLNYDATQPPHQLTVNLHNLITQQHQHPNP